MVFPAFFVFSVRIYRFHRILQAFPDRLTGRGRCRSRPGVLYGSPFPIGTWFFVCDLISPLSRCRIFSRIDSVRACNQIPKVRHTKTGGDHAFWTIRVGKDVFRAKECGPSLPKVYARGLDNMHVTWPILYLQAAQRKSLLTYMLLWTASAKIAQLIVPEKVSSENPASHC